MKKSAAREHFDKYEELADILGFGQIEALILPRISPERIKAALAAGDEHLNSIPLQTWDDLAGMVPLSRWAYGGPVKHCPSCTCGAHEGRAVGNGPRLSIEGIWARARTGKGWWSLAERVCVLKHVARHVIAGVPAPEEA